jgi:hypothetical protein
MSLTSYRDLLLTWLQRVETDQLLLVCLSVARASASSRKSTVAFRRILLFRLVSFVPHYTGRDDYERAFAVRWRSDTPGESPPLIGRAIVADSNHSQRSRQLQIPAKRVGKLHLAGRPTLGFKQAG